MLMFLQFVITILCLYNKIPILTNQKVFPNCHFPHHHRIVLYCIVVSSCRVIKLKAIFIAEVKVSYSDSC